MLWKDQSCLVYGSGKPPSYRWHLAYPKCHIFLAKNPLPVGATPSVYVSLSSELIWREGIRKATEHACEILKGLGGDVAAVQVSRCDPCVDFFSASRLTSQFLEEHRVPKNRFQDMKKSGDDLETYYNGAKAGEIQLRIYDKGRDTIKKGKLSKSVPMPNQLTGEMEARLIEQEGPIAYVESTSMTLSNVGNEGPEALAYGPRDAAKALGISERLLWTITKAGNIPYRRIGERILYPVRLLQERLESRDG